MKKTHSEIYSQSECTCLYWRKSNIHQHILVLTCGYRRLEWHKNDVPITRNKKRGRPPTIQKTF